MRHLAKQYSININEITGTGNDGRVTKEDVMNFMEKPKAAPSAPQIVPPPLTGITAEDQVKKIVGI